MNERKIRLFVSSPSDVKAERDRVVIVAERLNGTFHSLIKIDVVRWEDEFYHAGHSFQEQIDAGAGKMAEIDILVCVLWGRIGLKLSPKIWKRDEQTVYESGTTYEYEAARAHSEHNGGVPAMYLFRKSAPILYRADHAEEDVEQHQALEKVWQRWTQTPDGYNAAAYQNFSDTDHFERQLEGCLRQWLDQQGITIKSAVWDRRLKGSPFCGLTAFEASHSAVFFGREAAISRILTKLRTFSFLLLVGASGTGKSSLLRAGLIPRIVKPGVIPDIDLWRVALITPSKDSFLELAQAIYADTCLKPELEDLCGSIDGLVEALRSGEAGLALLRSALNNAADKRADAQNYADTRPARILLAIDQLERLFIESHPDEIEPFARLVQDMVAAGIAYVVATLRSDSYASFQSVAAFSSLRENGATHDLLPPNALELEEIVTRPVLACYPPLVFESDPSGKSLASRLIDDARGGDFLPLLQMTLDYLFEAEKSTGDGVLRYSDYKGIDQAVIQVASEAFSTMGETARASLPALITALIHDVSLDATTAQRTVTLQPVRRASFERNRPERAALIDAFVARRLLTSEEVAGEIQVRAVHDALLRIWPEAITIVIENEHIIRIRRTLEPLVEQWTEAGKSPDSDLLLTSPALTAGARQLVERIGDDCPPAMRAYIDASVVAETGRAEREAQQRSAIMSATSGMRARSIPYYRLAAGLLLTLLVLVRVINPLPVESLSWLAFDTYQRISPRVATVLPVLIADIDEASLKEYGQFPWPRTLLADLVNRLTELGAVEIGFDIVFAEPDRWSPGVMANTIKDIDGQTRDRLSSLPSNDEIFANAIRRSRVVIAESGTSSEGNRALNDRKLWAGFAMMGNDAEPFLFAYHALLRNIPAIEQAAAGAGLISTIGERDGVFRRLPIVMEAGGLKLPSLSLEMLRVVTGSSTIIIDSSPAGIQSVSLRKLRIPTDKNGRLLLHFSGHKLARYISVSDILNGRVPPDRVKGHMVIVGTSAALMGDLRATPVNTALPGAEIHAEAIENILTGSMLDRPNTIEFLEIGLVVVIGTILTVLMPLVSARLLALISAIVLMMVLGGSWMAFKQWRLLIDPVYPLIAMAIFITTMTFFIYRHSEAQRGKIRGFFAPQIKRS